MLLFFCNVKKQDSYVKISLEKRGDILYNRSVGTMGMQVSKNAPMMKIIMPMARRIENEDAAFG